VPFGEAGTPPAAFGPLQAGGVVPPSPSAICSISSSVR